MRILIRADASEKMGTGHIMRCLALAQALIDENCSVTFLSQGIANSIESRLNSEGIDVFTPKSFEPGGVSDIAFTIDYFRKSSSDILVLDGYHFELKYQCELKADIDRILFIDDSNGNDKISADLILNQNIWATQKMYSAINKNTRMLIGPSYALFRKEFHSFAQSDPIVNKKVKNILVTMGGSDPGNVIPRALSALNLLKNQDLEIRILLGANNQKSELIRKIASASSFAVKLLEHVDSMPPLMQWADLAISGGGFTTFELALLGVPSLLCIETEYQEPNVKKFESLGLCYNLGNSTQCTAESMAEGLQTVISNFELRQSYSLNAHSIFDSFGAKRVASAILT